MGAVRSAIEVDGDVECGGCPLPYFAPEVGARVTLPSGGVRTNRREVLSPTRSRVDSGPLDCRAQRRDETLRVLGIDAD